MENKYTKEDIKNKINFLVGNDIDIVAVQYPDLDVQYFIAEGFEPPSHGSVSSVPFIRFKGTDITNWLQENIYNINNTSHFLDQISAFITREKPIYFQFSENHHWIFFTK